MTCALKQAVILCPSKLAHNLRGSVIGLHISIVVEIANWAVAGFCGGRSVESNGIAYVV
jgi:hypothetical protein